MIRNGEHAEETGKQESWPIRAHSRIIPGDEGKVPWGSEEENVGDGSSRRSSWAAGSVWSAVCAMELGLLSETCLKSISFVGPADDTSGTPTTDAAKENPAANRRRISQPPRTVAPRCPYDACNVKQQSRSTSVIPGSLQDKKPGRPNNSRRKKADGCARKIPYHRNQKHEVHARNSKARNLRPKRRAKSKNFQDGGGYSCAEDPEIPARSRYSEAVSLKCKRNVRSRNKQRDADEDAWSNRIKYLKKTELLLKKACAEVEAMNRKLCLEKRQVASPRKPQAEGINGVGRILRSRNRTRSSTVESNNRRRFSYNENEEEEEEDEGFSGSGDTSTDYDWGCREEGRLRNTRTSGRKRRDSSLGFRSTPESGNSRKPDERDSVESGILCSDVSCRSSSSKMDVEESFEEIYDNQGSHDFDFASQYHVTDSKSNGNLLERGVALNFKENSFEERQKQVKGKTSKKLRRNRNTRAKETAERKVGDNKDAIMEMGMIGSRKQEELEEQEAGRRVTRGLAKINKENFIGKVVWGYCSGWWPALIVDADHVGMLAEPGKQWVYWIGESRISLLSEKSQIDSFYSNLENRLQPTSSVARSRAIDATIQILHKRFACTLTKPYYAWIRSNCVGPNGSLDEIKFYPYPPQIQRRLVHLRERNASVTEKYLEDQKNSNNDTKKVAEKTKESTEREKTDASYLPLEGQKPGVIAWAKISGHNWWPAMIIDYRDCCMREPGFGCQWIMWYGDYQLSEVHHNSFLKFSNGIAKMREYIDRTKKHSFLLGVLQAAKDYCSRFGYETDHWTLTDVFKHFSKSSVLHSESMDVPNPTESTVKIYDKYSAHMVAKLNEAKNNAKVDDERRSDIKKSEDLRSVKSGKLALELLCIKCLKTSEDGMENHPFFKASLCKECSDQFKPCMFVFGNDGKCFYCTICAGTGMVVICDREDCPRVYCTACLKYLLFPKTFEDVLLEDPWECLLCKNESGAHSDALLQPRPYWKDKLIDLFRTKSNTNLETIKSYDKKSKIRVLSLFDGLSTGLLVLLKLGLDVDVYYASEIDKDALTVSISHFGDRVIHLGNAKDISKEKIQEMAPIDLLIGGSPCNDLSLANPARLGLYDPKGTGVLFFEYCRILEQLKKANKGHHLFWMYENVASMPTEYRLAMNKHLGQEPDVIDSADFSPQHRLRLYWHNLPLEPHSLCLEGEQDVQDILTPNCQRYALVKKIRTVTTKVNSLKQGKLALKPILMKNESDSIWITELEQIFGFPRHYTDVKNLSATKRQKLIGKSWSVQTLTAILGSLCPFFECTANSTNQLLS